MEVTEREVEIYVGPDDACPFKDWLDSLQDKRARASVRARINRLRLGNPGDFKSVGSGVFELRINYGPGTRVYYGQVGTKLVILLNGGDKSSQSADIKKAIEFWVEYTNRSK